jgi:hypothetical protein
LEVWPALIDGDADAALQEAVCEDYAYDTTPIMTTERFEVELPAALLLVRDALSVGASVWLLILGRIEEIIIATVQSCV